MSTMYQLIWPLDPLSKFQFAAQIEKRKMLERKRLAIETFVRKNYRLIIEKRAGDGWRYVGYIPTKQRGTGHTQEMDLIFEKEE